MKTHGSVRRDATRKLAKRAEESHPHQQDAQAPSSSHRLSLIGSDPPVQRMKPGQTPLIDEGDRKDGGGDAERGEAGRPAPVTTGNWGWVRWYEYDGDHTYQGRTTSGPLETFKTVWTKCPENHPLYPTYECYMNPAATLRYKARNAARVAREASPVVARAAEGAVAMQQHIRDFANTQLTQQAMTNRHEQFIVACTNLKEALKAYVAEHVTFTKLLGISVLGIGAIAALALLPAMPWWLGLASTTISTLYSVGLMYRWTTKVEEIPWFIRGSLAVGNTIALTVGLGTWLSHLIKAWIEAKEFFPALQATPGVWAAIPFAIAIESVMREIYEKYQRISAQQAATATSSAPTAERGPGERGPTIAVGMPSASIDASPTASRSSAAATERTPLNPGHTSVSIF